MLIIADENIPFVSDAFSSFGEVRLVAGRALTREQLSGADILLVRSVTSVDEILLDGTSVQFVATATVGTDHIDTRYLQKRDIGFAYAPGSNAESVAEYLITALIVLKQKYCIALDTMILGIVGVGNIGSRIKRYAAALGMKTVCCDPPLHRTTGSSEFVPFDFLMQSSDIITFHVPLVTEGGDRTVHLVDETFFSAICPGTFLINTSRGDVIDEAALIRNRHRLGGLVLDVWNHEPTINKQLCVQSDIATPHIAGYSYDGKVRGTEAIYRAACTYFSVPALWKPENTITPAKKILTIAAEETDPVAALILQAYPIMEDDARLRFITSPECREIGAYFDGLRKKYPKRLEFSHFAIDTTGLTDDVVRQLYGLGFSIAHAAG